MTGDEEGLSRISWSQGTASASLQVWGCSYEGFRCASALRPFGQDLDCDFGCIPWSDRASEVFRDFTRKSRFAAAISSEISSRRLWGPSGLSEVAWNFRVPLRRTDLLGSFDLRILLHTRIGTSLLRFFITYFRVSARSVVKRALGPDHRIVETECREISWSGG